MFLRLAAEDNRNHITYSANDLRLCAASKRHLPGEASTKYRGVGVTIFGCSRRLCLVSH